MCVHIYLCTCACICDDYTYIHSYVCALNIHVFHSKAALAQHLQSTFNVKIDVSKSSSMVKINGDKDDVELAKIAMEGIHTIDKRDILL